MYLLAADDSLMPAFKDVWAGFGDSIVVVGGDGLWNCHIHTDDIGAAIEAGIDAGQPRDIRVTDLADQVEEERWVRGSRGTDRHGFERGSYPGDPLSSPSHTATGFSGYCTPSGFSASSKEVNR